MKIPKLPRKTRARANLSIVLKDEKILDNFRVIENLHVQRAFEVCLILTTIAASIFGYAAMNLHRVTEVVYISIGISIILSLLNIRDLFYKFPQVLLSLWRQKLFLKPGAIDHQTRTISPQNDEYLLDFFAETKVLLRNRFLDASVGSVGVMVMSWIIWMFDQSWLLQSNVSYQFSPGGIVFFLLPRLIFLFTGAICGIIGWRVLMIARQLAKLGTKFEVNLQLNHPDGCGGMSPIGGLCLILTYCLIPFPLLVGIWLLFVNFLDPADLQLQSIHVAYFLPTLQALIVPLVAIDFLGFFYPPISIHNSMIRAKYNLHARLDRISQQINVLHATLLTDAINIAPQDGRLLEEKIDFLKRVYNRFMPIPTWPYKGGHLISLTTAQLIPIIAMLSSFIGFLQAVFIR